MRRHFRLRERHLRRLLGGALLLQQPLALRDLALQHVDLRLGLLERLLALRQDLGFGLLLSLQGGGEGRHIRHGGRSEETSVYADTDGRRHTTQTDKPLLGVEANVDRSTNNYKSRRK